MLYIALGERCNTKNNPRARRVDSPDWPAAERRYYENSGRYWELTRRIAAFTAKQRDMITSLLPVDPRDEIMWMNLLMPHPIPGMWNLQEARKAATLFMGEVPPGAIIACCGTRVMRAFTSHIDGKYPQQLGDVVRHERSDTWWTRLPHPSGRNLQWNDKNNMQAVRDRLLQRVRFKVTHG